MSDDMKTTEPMTEDELARIDACVSKATKGPWRWWTSNSFRRLSSDATGKDGDVAYATTHPHDGHPDIVISDADRDFIEQARTDEPRLLAEVRRLRALVASDCANRATIAVERTGGAFSIASNEFRVTLPNGTTSTIWSPPWNDYMPTSEAAGALKHAAGEWFTLCEAWQKQAEEDAEREHARQEDAAEDRREARTLEREFLDGDTARDST